MSAKLSMRFIALAIGLFWSASAPKAVSEEPRQGSKADLTPQTAGKLQALIGPHANEWRHIKVNWMTDVVASRKKAMAEDKPIVVLYTGGAGYNEPLGVC